MTAAATTIDDPAECLPIGDRNQWLCKLVGHAMGFAIVGPDDNHTVLCIIPRTSQKAARLIACAVNAMYAQVGQRLYKDEDDLLVREWIVTPGRAPGRKKKKRQHSMAAERSDSKSRYCV